MIFPTEEAGGVVIRNPDGSPANPPDVQNAYVPAPGYVVTCEMLALPASCDARVEAKQINNIVSELISFAECLDPDGPWNCDALTNLCTSFATWSAAFEASLAFLPLSGGTMTGPLLLADAPVDDMEAANKGYVDDAIAAAEGLDTTQFVDVVGDTMTGNLRIQPPAASPALILDKPAGAFNGVISGSMNGLLRWQTIMGSSAPEAGANSGSDFGLVAFDDGGAALFSVLNFFRATGLGTVKGDPTAALGIATKQYVDNTVTGGIPPPFPAGSILLFYNAAAPTGWTKLTTQNDKAIRVVSGTGGVAGGSNAFSTVMAQTVTGGTTPTAGTSATGLTSNGTNVITVWPDAVTNKYVPTNIGAAWSAVESKPGAFSDTTWLSRTPNSAISYTSTMIGSNVIAVTTNNAGATAHSHPITMAIQYIDMILASKD